jgi:hypothetical protein
VLEQARNSGPHVFTLKEWRRHLLNDPVCGAYTALYIGAHDPLAGGIC